nr:MAG: hypothetical protein [Gammatorquevirus sp.]
MQSLSATDFYKKTPFNSETQTQIWMSQIADAHDNYCNCDCPFAHLLASIFPPGHKDRDLTINQILQRDYQQCHSGGEGEESHGMAGGAGGGFKNIKEENTEEFPEEEIEGLLAAAEDAAAR